MLIESINTRLSEDEKDIEDNTKRIIEHTTRLTNLDGIIEIPMMESGSVECVSNTGFVYTNNVKRIRTPEGVTIQAHKGDIITSSNWSITRFYGGYKKSDDTYVQIVTRGADYAWKTMLDNGLVTWGTAVNDAHTCTNMTRIKDGCVKVFSASKDRLNIIKNLCCGNFIACSNIDAGITGVSFENGVLTIATGDSGASTTFMKEEGTILSTVTGTTASYTMTGTEKYVRAVVTLTSGAKVWTQPIINLFSTDYDDYLELSM